MLSRFFEITGVSRAAGKRELKRVRDWNFGFLVVLLGETGLTSALLVVRKQTFVDGVYLTAARRYFCYPILYRG